MAIDRVLPLAPVLLGGTSVQSVSARDLHLFLEINKDFSDWIKAQLDGLFIRGADFEVFPQKGENLGGRPRVEYSLTLDCAKSIAMMSRTAKGAEARAYFLECEKRALAGVQVPTTLSGALRLAAEQAEMIEAQAAALEAARPAVEFVDKYVDATATKGFRQVCKLLKANEARFREFLLSSGIWYRLGSEYVPYSEHINAGRFVVKAGTAHNSDHAFNQTRFTTKGIEWVAGKWAAHISLGAA